MAYGISYQGSKNTIAKELIDFLPKGKRFVDLFGGGFAMSHAALLSDKYETVLFNEIDSQVVDLVLNSINGEYNENSFKPKFVTREEFFKENKNSAYIRLVWSFSNKRRRLFI